MNHEIEQHDEHRPYDYVYDPEDYGTGKKRSRWKRALVLFFLFLLLGSTVYAATLIYNVAKISTKPLDMTGLVTDGSGRTNILILGVGDKGHAGEKLSDTMMVMSIDSRRKQVAQISLPRDMRVLVPGYGYRKINQANALGGSSLAMQTVSQTLNLPIHYYVETNFSGMRSMVDAVGGLEVDVKERLYDPEYPCDDNEAKPCGIDIQPGLQHMDGILALQYARCRKGTCGNDFGRAQRQQEVINLLRNKMLEWNVLLNPVRLGALTIALNQSIETDMGSYQLARAAYLWRQSSKVGEPIRLVLHTGQGGYLRPAGGSSDLVPVDGDYSAVQERVNGIFDLPVEKTDLPE